MKLKIDLFSEIICPWCFIGVHRLDKVLTERFPALEVDIAHHPILLNRDCPAEGILIADLARARHGVDAASLWARPHQEARSSGLPLDLSRQTQAYPTQPAHTLIRLARHRGTQHALAIAIFRAYFIDALDISSPDVLAQIAGRHGFEPDEAARLSQDLGERRLTEQAAAHATQIGVRSVPHYVFTGGGVLIGGRSEDELAQTIEAARSGTAEHQRQ